MQTEDNAIEMAIRQIKKGVLTKDGKLAGTGFIRLHDIGVLAVPALKAELGRINLRKVDRRGHAALLAGLATILHDISEEDSLAFIDGALSGRHHPVNGATLRIIRRHRQSHFRKAKINDINVWESMAIDPRYQATKHIQRWLQNVPENDLSGISRIYIIEEKPEQDFLGYYFPSTAFITLVWRSSAHPNSPIHWLLRFLHEGTFYHEVGHHRHGHEPLGQDPAQEEEANRYSVEKMREAHLWLRMIRTILRRNVRRR